MNFPAEKRRQMDSVLLTLFEIKLRGFYLSRHGGDVSVVKTSSDLVPQRTRFQREAERNAFKGSAHQNKKNSRSN
jgi:hypothetical protein